MQSLHPHSWRLVAVLGNIRDVDMAYEIWQYLLHNYAESIIPE
jgi:hypothetical protein